MMTREPSEEFVASLQAIVKAAAAFALHAGRDMQGARPTQYRRFLEAFNSGVGELQVTVQLSPEPQVRFSMFRGAVEEILFDTTRGTPCPPLPPLP